MKKISVLLTFGLFFYTTTIVSTEFNFEDDDDFAIDTDLNTISLDNLDPYKGTPTTENADNIAAMFSVIYGLGGLNTLLNTPLYQRTSPLRTRPILEYPLTLPYGFDMQNKNALSCSLFLNSWSHKNFTKNSQTLDSYFLLGDTAKVAVMEEVGNIINDQSGAQILEALNLFNPATVQENRMGAILEAQANLNKIRLTAQLPILYAERNLYLTPSEQAAIEASVLGSMLSSDGVDAEEFKYQHLVMDQFGFGDFKLKAMKQFHATDHFDLDFGGFVILPTARALKKGIIGTWFEQNNERAYFNLATIDIENVTTEDQNNLTSFILAALDKLNSNILNAPLGNNGHIVIAPSYNSNWYFAHNWKFSSDASLQIPLPCTEQRFYQKIKPESTFLHEYTTASDAGNLATVTFLNQAIQDLLFPYVFSTMVFPGIVINSTNQFVFTYQMWDFYLGSNFWYQGAEYLSNPKGASQDIYTYAYPTAAASSALQEKIFGKINCNLDTTNYSWSLSLYGDITVWNSGIGNDFTLGLCVDCKF